MKLYTEIEIKESLESIGLELMVNNFFQVSEPIELLSDEEIKEYLNSKYFSDKMYREYFKLGSIWMKQQILNKNK